MILLVIAVVLFLVLFIVGLIEINGGNLKYGGSQLRGGWIMLSAWVVSAITTFTIIFTEKVAQVGLKTAFLEYLKTGLLGGGLGCFGYAIVERETGLIRRLILGLVGIALFAVGWLIHPDEAKAGCPTRFINPITDICWQCLYPIKIGEAGDIGGGASCDLSILGNEVPVCKCPAPAPIMQRVGMSMSFWEPARMVETVSDPWCFPSIGTKVMEGKNMGYDSAADGEHGRATNFRQAHWVVFPVKMILDTVLNSACKSTESMDIGYVTEIDPLWNDDKFGALIQPEAVLFANPLAQVSCSADAVVSNGGCANSLQPWCMGAWGSAYPMNGTINTANEQQAIYGLTARMIYKLSRTPAFTFLDPAVWNCMSMPTPVWIKHHFRIQAAMPVRDFTCHPIGRTDLIVGAGKSIPYLSDNSVQIVWRQRGCCASY